MAHKTARSLDAELDELPDLSRSELQARWRTVFGRNPPPKIDHSLLVYGIAYRLQERAFGGLKPGARRALSQIAERERTAEMSARKEHRKLRPGTVLLREWHGRAHHVTVLEDGFRFESKRFGSLSEIARAITGSRWSGPLFFGLKRRTEREETDGRS